MYRQINGKCHIFFAGFWKMNTTKDLSRWCFDVRDATGPTPPMGLWNMAMDGHMISVGEVRIKGVSALPFAAWEGADDPEEEKVR